MTLLDDVARTDPSFLNWMLTKDFAKDTKDLCRDALARRNTR